jgi:branched-chain amino acid transport system ATP-binding protein
VIGDGAVLEVKDLRSGYGFLQVLRGVSLSVERGELVALLGPNGAGKSTTLRSIAGLVPPWKGEVWFAGRPLAGLPAHQISRLGIGFVSETLNLFTGMTVYENLMLGAYGVADGRQRRESLHSVFTLFPRLAERRAQLAGTLSGGERRMLGIGRALMAAPALLLVDEPSLGLAPKLTQSLFAALHELRERGHTILLVEQNVPLTLEIADRVYLLEQGEIVLQGSAAQLAETEHVKQVYLGIL